MGEITLKVSLAWSTNEQKSSLDHGTTNGNHLRRQYVIPPITWWPTGDIFETYL